MNIVTDMWKGQPVDDRVYYIVYAGWYANPDCSWEPDAYVYGARIPCGHQLDDAGLWLSVVQQEAYDFCGIETAFAS